MDALSDVLRLVGPTGGVFLDAEFTEPWSIRGKIAPELCRPFMVHRVHLICFHYVVEGAVHLALEDSTTRQIRSGEVVLLSRNDMHILSSRGGLPPIGVDELINPGEAFGVVRIAHGGGGARTRMVCGFLGGNAQIHPLLANLPPAIVLGLAALPGGDWMARTFTYAAQTLAKGDPGAVAVIRMLSELLFVEAVRSYLSALPQEETGWLAGLRDPAIGRALSLMHARVDQNWTADALAQEVNLSRSAF